MILGPGYICSLAKARLFDLYKPSLLEKVAAQLTDEVVYNASKQFGLIKSTYAYLLVQARINLRRCFFVAMQLNNPRLPVGVKSEQV